MPFAFTPRTPAPISNLLVRKLLTIFTLIALSAVCHASTHPCEVARKYTRLVQEPKYDQIGSIFAEDAVCFTAVGSVMHGRQQISDFYQKFLRDRRPFFQTDNYVEQGQFCAMEVQVKVRVDSTGKVMLGTDGSAAIIPDGSSEPGICAARDGPLHG